MLSIKCIQLIKIYFSFPQGELSELTRNHINLDKTNAEKDISEESTIKCEKSVQVHTYKLHKEIENLKDMVETLRRDGRSTIGKTGRPDYALESLGKLIFIHFLIIHTDDRCG